MSDKELLRDASFVGENGVEYISISNLSWTKPVKKQVIRYKRYVFTDYAGRPQIRVYDKADSPRSGVCAPVIWIDTEWQVVEV